jgi:hypothetical protein
LEEHGVKNYPFGRDGVLDLFCPARTDGMVEPKVEVKASIPLEVEIRWAGGSKTISIKPTA